MSNLTVSLPHCHPAKVTVTSVCILFSPGHLRCNSPGLPVAPHTWSIDTLELRVWRQIYDIQTYKHTDNLTTYRYTDIPWRETSQRHTDIRTYRYTDIPRASRSLEVWETVLHSGIYSFWRTIQSYSNVQSWICGVFSSLRVWSF